MRKIFFIILVLLLISVLVACSDAAKVALGIMDLIEEDNTTNNVDVDINFGGSHVHTVGVIPAVDATCSSNGFTEGQYCLSCDKVLVEPKVIPFRAHTEVIDHAKESTCKEVGKTEGKHCYTCGKVILKQIEIPKKSHTEVIDPQIPPTCNTVGRTEGKHCAVCGECIVAQQTIPQTAHTYDNQNDTNCNECGFIRNVKCVHSEVEISRGYEATCTSAGLTDGSKCKNCGEIIVEQIAIAIKPHTEVVDIGFDSTCVSGGITDGKHCSICGAVTAEQTYIPVKAHVEMVMPGSEPTCLATGLGEGKCCSICGTILLEQKIIPTIDHIPGDWVEVKAPENTEYGIKQLQCTVCNKVISEENIYPLGTPDLYMQLSPDGQSYYVGKNRNISGKIVIPETYKGLPVTAIVAEAFKGGSGTNANANVNITEIVIPNTVVSIGDNAFWYCKSLQIITIPESVESIGKSAFGCCYALTDINVEQGNSYYSSINGNLYSKDGKTLIQYAIGKADTSFVIPDGVTTIGTYAFYSSKNLLKVTIPVSVGKIEKLGMDISNYDCELYYNGTTSQWYKISKESDWHGTGIKFSIRCTNENIEQ